MKQGNLKFLAGRCGIQKILRAFVSFGDKHHANDLLLHFKPFPVNTKRTIRCNFLEELDVLLSIFP